MRGYDRPQSTMLTLVNPEKRVPANHPIRLIKQLAEVALKFAVERARRQPAPMRHAAVRVRFRAAISTPPGQRGSQFHLYSRR
jgi:hypothetical protein